LIGGNDEVFCLKLFRNFSDTAKRSKRTISKSTHRIQTTKRLRFGGFFWHLNGNCRCGGANRNPEQKGRNNGIFREDSFGRESQIGGPQNL
jgi:hypothetical protein